MNVIRIHYDHLWNVKRKFIAHKQMSHPSNVKTWPLISLWLSLSQMTWTRLIQSLRNQFQCQNPTEVIKYTFILFQGFMNICMWWLRPSLLCFPNPNFIGNVIEGGWTSNQWSCLFLNCVLNDKLTDQANYGMLVFEHKCISLSYIGCSSFPTTFS